MEEVRQELERFRGKYDKQITINKDIEKELTDLRDENG